MIEIPLNSKPEQLFSIVLSNGNFDIRVALNSRTSIWTIGFSQLGIQIVDGVSLVGGIDLLKQYNIPIKNMFIINLDNSDKDPTNKNLGEIAKLFVLLDSEVPNVSPV